MIHTSYLYVDSFLNMNCNFLAMNKIFYCQIYQSFTHMASGFCDIVRKHTLFYSKFMRGKILMVSSATFMTSVFQFFS